MRTKRRNVLLVLFLLCCVLFAVYYFMTRGKGDHQPPELTVPDTVLSISVQDEEDALLRDVTAIDGVDGDVTSDVVVESVSSIYDGNMATVNYAAFDHSGNVTKAQRTLEYYDYVKPRFILSDPMLFREGTNFNVFGGITAYDAIDGDLKERVKGTLVSGQSTVERAGSYVVEFRVTNSLGDTTHLKLPVEVESNNTGDRRLELTEYLVYLKKNQTFDPMSYLSEDSRGRVLEIETDLDLSREGVYSVTYLPRNRDAYEKTRLIAVVEE